MGHLSPASGLPLARRDDVSATLHRWEAAMADESSDTPNPEPKRSLGYSSLGARALVIRETDAMRNGIRGLLREVSMARLVVGLPQALPPESRSIFGSATSCSGSAKRPAESCGWPNRTKTAPTST